MPVGGIFAVCGSHVISESVLDPHTLFLFLAIGRCCIFADAGQLVTVNALLALPFLGASGVFLLNLIWWVFFLGICNNYLKRRLIKCYSA